jgi:N6-L-threonylcarbamoyladenine synthase
MRGAALMPTFSRKARLLISRGKAKIDSYRPFTIQLCNATGESKQNLTLGVDAGYANIGFSVIDPTKEVFSCEIKLLEGQVERNNKRRMYRINEKIIQSFHHLSHSFYGRECSQVISITDCSTIKA